MSYDVRLLTADDQAAAWALGSVAFAYGDRQMPEGWTSDRPGRQTWGVFDDEGRLVAKAGDREQGHWFGGRCVPASGVAGVVVAPEARGHGLTRLVLTRLLAAARERGAAISTLFDTTPFPYRAMGWEEGGALQLADVPTATLAGLRVPAGMRLRAARPDDVPVLRELYRTVARDGTAVMDRSGPYFDRDAEEYLSTYDGVTTAVGDDGTVLGYASWDRDGGYGHDGRISVDDLIGLTADATTALLAMLGSWSSATTTVQLRVWGVDPVILATAVGRARISSRRPWMLRMVDAHAAVAARGWPPYLTGSVDLDLVDDACPWHTGRHRLVLDAGEGRLEPGGHGDVLLPARGLSLLYTGAATPEVVRRAGLLEGGSSADDAFLRAATAGPAPALLDYF